MDFEGILQYLRRIPDDVIDPNRLMLCALNVQLDSSHLLHFFATYHEVCWRETPKFSPSPPFFFVPQEELKYITYSLTPFVHSFIHFVFQKKQNNKWQSVPSSLSDEPTNGHTTPRRKSISKMVSTASPNRERVQAPPPHKSRSEWSLKDLGGNLLSFGTEIVTTSSGAFTSVLNQFSIDGAKGEGDEVVSVWQKPSAPPSQQLGQENVSKAAQWIFFFSFFLSFFLCFGWGNDKLLLLASEATM